MADNEFALEIDKALNRSNSNRNRGYFLCIAPDGYLLLGTGDHAERLHRDMVPQATMLKCCPCPCCGSLVSEDDEGSSLDDPGDPSKGGS